MVDGVDPVDWLAYVAPRNSRGAIAKPAQALDVRFYNEFKSLFLRFEGPTFTQAYEEAEEIAKKQRWPVCHIRTLRRRLKADVPRTMQILAREGTKAFERTMAPQIRGKDHFDAMDWVNADWHKFDVFVEWPGLDKPVRVQVCAFQDVMSGKILSWKVDLAPNSVATMSAFGAMVETYGIPRHCLFDNGMEFAAKNLTGGAKTRRRFTIREDEPDGILTLLGVKIHWAQVAYGEAKPLERAFGDWAERIAKDPRMAGAYVGKRPDAKPDNYASKAIPLTDFMRYLEEGIALHNARGGRRSATANGRSFDETFEASYVHAKVKQATKAQRRLWLMAHQVCKLDSRHGRMTLLGNGFHSEWMAEYAGQEVVARFDPADVQNTEVFIYTKAGELLGTTMCQKPVGFDSLTAAYEHAAAKRRRTKAARAALKAENPVPLGEAAARLDEARRDLRGAEPPKNNVVEGSFGTRSKRVATKPAPTEAAPIYDPAVEADAAAKVAEFKAKKAKKTPETAENDEQYAQFNWAMRVEAALKRGEAVGDDEVERLRIYQGGFEYRALLRLHQSASTDTPSAG
ncbi:MAG: transposase domain-containing protein [Pseudomonadota bacterium]